MGEDYDHWRTVTCCHMVRNILSIQWTPKLIVNIWYILIHGCVQNQSMEMKQPWWVIKSLMAACFQSSKSQPCWISMSDIQRWNTLRREQSHEPMVWKLRLLFTYFGPFLISPDPWTRRDNSKVICNGFWLNHHHTVMAMRTVLESRDSCLKRFVVINNWKCDYSNKQRIQFRRGTVWA